MLSDFQSLEALDPDEDLTKLGGKKRTWERPGEGGAGEGGEWAARAKATLAQSRAAPEHKGEEGMDETQEAWAQQHRDERGSAGAAGDVWGVGMAVWELVNATVLGGHMAMRGYDGPAREILGRADLRDYLGASTRGFLADTLREIPAQRATVDALYNSPFVAEHSDVMRWIRLRPRGGPRLPGPGGEGARGRGRARGAGLRWRDPSARLTVREFGAPPATAATPTRAMGPPGDPRAGEEALRREINSRAATRREPPRAEASLSHLSGSGLGRSLSAVGARPRTVLLPSVLSDPRQGLPPATPRPPLSPGAGGPRGRFATAPPRDPPGGGAGGLPPL